KTTSKYFELWNSKIKPDSMQLTSFGIVAGQYNRYFKSTGDITYLKRAEQALKKAVDIAAIGKSGYYRALARNYISQHRFKDALQWAKKAHSLGSDLNASQSLLFDVHMELGNYEKAEQYLDSIKNMSDFGYLIRLAKWNDHNGDLDTTIRFMEMALRKAESSKNRDLKLWSYTNLADYYGHAGRIKESYDHYIKSLEIDPENAYAKKGIAWIVFSHERNPNEALRILNTITQENKAPDFYALKSEIADYMDDEKEKRNNLQQYFNRVQNPSYGDMYNTYTISFHWENNSLKQAFKLAQREIANRPTPESYDLLAYSYYRIGKLDKALAIVDRHIEGKTYEPGILLHMAEIYKGAGNMDEVKRLKKELADAIYELGPSSEQLIASL
ncbi:MAG: hypothetical protein AAFZ89_10315, partial [Bacteroidota bacterium]